MRKIRLIGLITLLMGILITAVSIVACQDSCPVIIIAGVIVISMGISIIFT